MEGIEVMDVSMKRYVDLHMHTFYSDRMFVDPEFLVRLNVLNGINVMAISDYDNLLGYFAASREADKYDITLLSGVEITTPKFC